MTRLSHDERINDFDSVDDELAPPGYVNVWGIGNVKISDIKNRQLQEPADIQEDTGWVQFALGCDVASHGKDRTCVCLAQLTYDRRDQVHAEVKLLKRLRKGILFRDTTTQIKQIVRGVKDNACDKKVDITIGTDASGLGEGLAQEIAQELALEDCRSIYLTGGGYGYRTEGSNIYVAKSHLVSLLVAAIESGRMRFPRKLKELDVLLEEMAAFGETISEDTGNSSYGATGKMTHDDTIVSMGLTLVIGEICKPARLY